MDFLNSLFNASAKPNADKPNCSKQTCLLSQGKQLLNLQTQREKELTIQNKLMESNTYEGFTSNTLGKNNSELDETTALSNQYSNNINRYNNEYPDLVADARSYSKMTNRNEAVNRNFKEHVDILYDIKAEKEGCYKSKQSDKSSLIYQADLKDVSIDTCKNRAFDLGYSGFAIKKNSGGQLGCYITNNIQGEKTGDIATKSMTSYSFKKNKDANMGGLLKNGQVGTFTNNIGSNLITDLTEISGCDIQGGNILINDKSIVATYGGNCKPPPLTPQFVNTGKRQTWISSETYAQNMGGRLATLQDVRDYIQKKGGPLVPGQDQWVAVTNGGARDWVQIGNSVHVPGKSHIKDVNYYPAWGDNIAIPTPVANYVFWMGAKV